MYRELEYNRVSDSSDEATYDDEGVLKQLSDLDHSSDSEVVNVRYVLLSVLKIYFTFRNLINFKLLGRKFWKLVLIFVLTSDGILSLLRRIASLLFVYRMP